MHNILDAVCDAKDIIIAGHTRPDGDCVGSCMGLYHYIRDNYPDKKVCVRLEDVPDCYRVIPDTDLVITDYEEDRVYDLFIALDASDRARLAGAQKYFDTAGHRICIDHHISNQAYADENLILPDASSTAEVLVHLIDPDKISLSAATALYIGIICDSGVFKHSNTGRETMHAAGLLMEKGIPYWNLIDEVFYQKTYLQNRILGRCLLDSTLALEGRVISCLVTRDTLDSFGGVHSDLEGVIDQMRITKGVKAAILISENKDHTYKFSMRANDGVNVSVIACQFGGGGHIKAAGFSYEGDPHKALDAIITMIGEQLSYV